MVERVARVLIKTMQKAEFFKVNPRFCPVRIFPPTPVPLYTEFSSSHSPAGISKEVVKNQAWITKFNHFKHEDDK